jgi:hypothetical protein
VLKKSFLAVEQNLLGPLMRFARGDVRDHIVSHKNDHGPSYRPYRGLQRKRRLRIHFREIFGVVRFSTFATVSAHFGHGAMSDLSLLSEGFVAKVPKRRATKFPLNDKTSGNRRSM